MMKAIGALLSGVTLAAVTLVGAVPARAGSEIHRETFTIPMQFDHFDPCTGAPGTWDTLFEGTAQSVALDGGGWHVTVRAEGEVAFTPDDPSQPAYSGVARVRLGENGNERNSTYTNTFSEVVTAADGSRVVIRHLVHWTTDASGDVTVSIDRAGHSCGG